ncbi:sialidase family protein [Autumnicola musiva]|uniref:Sialidase family protein n=1 Tax=Autumnicola musiva TaxID=3075589 RepID=A0ABU3D743_9FLAO|nr:sialidase family protein [Zunongwangia sp. F117]MDT0677180.1 sialidase family protein [Zunongwangia sp. F117]
MQKVIRIFPVLGILIAVNCFYSCGIFNSKKDQSEHQNGIVLEEFVYKTADFPQSHSATLLELEDGELLCAFFGGTRERDPDVEIRLSRKNPDGTWTAPVSIADGVQSEGDRLPTWNPVLYQNSEGKIMLFYKVGPSPSEWWGMMKTSTDGGHTWSQAKRLRDNVIGPVKNKPIEIGNGIILSGSSTEDNGWQVHIERSTDGGETWDLIGPINDAEEMGAIQPTLLKHSDGRIQMLCRTRTEIEHIAQSWSNDGGLTWSEMSVTDLPNNNSGIDAVTLKDGRQLIVYNHSTRKQPGMGHKGRGVLNVSISQDGKNWEAALVLDYLDESGKQFSYPAVIQTSDGLVHIAYTWHRKRIKHVVIDPEKLKTYPIQNGKWPADRIPLITSIEQ